LKGVSLTEQWTRYGPIGRRGIEGRPYGSARRFLCLIPAYARFGQKADSNQIFKTF
jgi:hypothetical protein